MGLDGVLKDEVVYQIRSQECVRKIKLALSVKKGREAFLNGRPAIEEDTIKHEEEGIMIF